MLFSIIKIVQKIIKKYNNNNKKLKRKLCLFPSIGIFGEKKSRKNKEQFFSLSGAVALLKNLSALFHAYLGCVQAQIPAPI